MVVRKPTYKKWWFDFQGLLIVLEPQTSFFLWMEMVISTHEIPW